MEGQRRRTDVTENASLVYKDQLVQSLSSVLRQGGHGLRVAPSLLKSVIHHHAWQDRFVTALKRRQQYVEFLRFVTDPPPNGLGPDLDTLQRICANDQEALDLLAKVTRERSGANQDVATRSLQARRSVGENDHHAIQALRDDAHTALREAGLRRIRVMIHLDEPEAAARTIKRATSPAYVQALIEALRRDEDPP